MVGKYALESRECALRLRDTHARAAYVSIYEPTFFLAKNKNQDSDLGWTADLKINLDKL